MLSCPEEKGQAESVLSGRAVLEIVSKKNVKFFVLTVFIEKGFI